MITFNATSKTIVGSLKGKNFSVPYNEKVWDKMVKLNEEFNKVTDFKDAEKVLAKFEKLTKTSLKDEIEEITSFMTYNPNTKTYHLKQGKNVSKIPMPDNLVSKIKFAADKNLPVDPFIKFYTRALRNPKVVKAKRVEDATEFLSKLFSYVFRTFVSKSLLEEFMKEEGFSEEVAREKATVFQTPITMEGLLCTKKVVNIKEGNQRYKWVLDDDGNKKKVLRDGVAKTIDEDTGEITIEDPAHAEDWVFSPAVYTSGEDFYCGEGDEAPKGQIIRVGQECRLEGWSSVNCNDNQTCVKGLHTGNQDYIDGWERKHNATLNCFVDPADIGAAPGDAMIRVLRYFPHSIKNRDVDNRNIYHSSEYAAKGDARWKEYRTKAITELNKKVEEYKKSIESQADLLPD